MNKVSDSELHELKSFLSSNNYTLLMLLSSGYKLIEIARLIKVKLPNIAYKLIDLGKEIQMFDLLNNKIVPLSTDKQYLRGFNDALSMLQEEACMGRASKLETHERRTKLKALYTQGVTNTEELASALSVTRETVLEDVKWLNAYYLKLVAHNPFMAEKQFARVMKLVDEMDAVKQELWDTVRSLKSEEQTTPAVTYLQEAIDMLKDSDDPTVKEALDHISHAQNSIRKVKRGNYKTKIEALSGIVNRIDKESKLLNMFNPTQLVNSNYITKESFLVMLDTIKKIIAEFVPGEKIKYAVERLKGVDVKEVGGEDIIDAELM